VRVGEFLQQWIPLVPREESVQAAAAHHAGAGHTLASQHDLRLLRHHQTKVYSI